MVDAAFYSKAMLLLLWILCLVFTPLDCWGSVLGPSLVLMSVIVLWLFPTMACVVLQCVIFPDHTKLTFCLSKTFFEIQI